MLTEKLYLQYFLKVVMVSVYQVDARSFHQFYHHGTVRVSVVVLFSDFVPVCVMAYCVN